MRDQISYTSNTNKQSYSSVHFNLYIFRWQTGRHTILDQMLAGIPGVQSALNLFMYTYVNIYARVDSVVVECYYVKN